MSLVHCRRPAMATLFEIWLVGEDEEHLLAVGEAVLDEVQRVELLMSRFDPGAELARLNQGAVSRPVKVSLELFAVLQDCQRWCEATDGFFDPCVTSARGGSMLKLVQLDAEKRTVRFTHPHTQLDLGGYGKGYALDAAVPLLEEFGVTSAFLHGGTSSILAVGTREGGRPWTVGLCDPFEVDGNVIAELPLCGGFSSSAILGDADSDIFDPKGDGPLRGRACCAVTTPTALEAEVLSTALIAMGKQRAPEYAERQSFSGARSIVWLEREAERTILDWMVRQDHG